MSNQLGLALSGGGLRATLFHLGVIKYLRDINKLGEVGHISSVSGGSILAAHMVLHWDKYVNGSEQEFKQLSDEILEFSQWDVRGRVLRRWVLAYPLYLIGRFLNFISPKLYRLIAELPFLHFFFKRTNTFFLMNAYDKKLYKGKNLSELAGPLKPDISILSTNLATSDSCYFNGKVFFDGKTETSAELVNISLAVAASSAFPGFFVPVKLRGDQIGQSSEKRYYLTDGGVHDNLGIRRFLDLGAENFKQIIVSDAGAAFNMKEGEEFSYINTVLRAPDILMKRINELESGMAKKYQEKDKFIFFKITDTVEDDEALSDTIQEKLQYIRTDLDNFSKLEVDCIVRHGYCVAREKSEESQDSKQQTKAWRPLGADIRPKSPTKALKKITKSKKIKAFRLAAFLDWITYLYLLVITAAFVQQSMTYKKLQQGQYMNLTAVEQAGYLISAYKVARSNKRSEVIKGLQKKKLIPENQSKLPRNFLRKKLLEEKNSLIFRKEFQKLLLE